MVLGRYVYDWASQVYSSLCITFFMPLLMLLMAQQAAYSKQIQLCTGMPHTKHARSMAVIK